MGNTFNRDFQRMLNVKEKNLASEDRYRDAGANLRNEQAGVVGADSRSAIDLQGAQAGFQREKTGLLGREVESLANVRDQNARATRLGANIDLGEGVNKLNAARFNASDFSPESGGLGGQSALSYRSPSAVTYSNYSEGATAEDFAKPGSVQDMYGRYADGGLVEGGTPNSGMADYGLYRDAATKAGVAVLPMEQAIPMMAQARAAKRQEVMQMIAQGGTTPPAQGYASGGEIDGPGTGKSDSIPAVVDGAGAAAVSDGEFHIPKHVVDYFGTKMFDGLVEKAQQAGKANARKPGYKCGGAVQRH